jgi:hypothetical protein
MQSSVREEEEELNLDEFYDAVSEVEVPTSSIPSDAHTQSAYPREDANGKDASFGTIGSSTTSSNIATTGTKPLEAERPFLSGQHASHAAAVNADGSDDDDDDALSAGDGDESNGASGDAVADAAAAGTQQQQPGQPQSTSGRAEARPRDAMRDAVDSGKAIGEGTTDVVKDAAMAVAAKDTGNAKYGAGEFVTTRGVVLL